MSTRNLNPSQQFLKLQHALTRLLPDSINSQESARVASQIYHVCLSSTFSLYHTSRVKDEIWHHLRIFGITPSEHDINNVYVLLKLLHSEALKKYPSFSREDSRLSVWNSATAGLFDHLLLSTNVAHRVLDPRPEHPLSDSIGTLTTDPISHPSTTTVSGLNYAFQKSGADPTSAFDPSWLRVRCSQLEVVRSGGLPAHEMAASVLSLLSDPKRTNDHLQSDLFDAFGGDFDAVSDVLRYRPQICRNSDAISADCAQAYEVHLHGDPSGGSSAFPLLSARSSSRQFRGSKPSVVLGAQHSVRRDSREKHRHQKASSKLREDHDDMEVDEAVQAKLQLGMSAFEERQRAFPGVSVERDAVIGAIDKVTLPKGSTRTVEKGYEEIFVPPPESKPVIESQLVDIETCLASYPYLLSAMKGVKTLNRLQSMVFPVAFHSNENLLVCAPTGAGKTNVALLTIFREIVAVRLRDKPMFKVVYVAPMKALAAEVTKKFSQRLGSLGLTVREFTGDMSLTRAESLETHVLVTTPEKWDVVTRKSGSEVGEAVTLFIVDEIHLLHDDRGAVLESIVARTLRFSETAQRQIRLVGLSATLPNYGDVGSFMRVNPKKGLFHFDRSYRPVPLSQTFIGVSEGTNSNSTEARRRKEGKIHELAWKKVKDALQRGHQAMIFVHSRKGTSNAAREMISRATQDELGDIFLGGSSKGVEAGGLHTNGSSTSHDNIEESCTFLPAWAAKEISRSKIADIRELCSKGVGIHNAGLPRSDRMLVEKLFAEGVIRLLCCTATLAWGVNLPARAVIIMGTEVYDAEKAKFVQLGMLDVMQIFGRAGRPQFDTLGEGTIITEHEHLSTYLNLLTSSLPIESQLSASPSRMADHLNAEIVSGTVSSVDDGIRWLSYTYLSVRMPQNPQVYGINWDEVHLDYHLLSRREKLIKDACKELDDARMCSYDPEHDVLSPRDLGRVASHFYVSHETIVLWSDLFAGLKSKLGSPTDSFSFWNAVYCEVVHAVSCATEFEQMRSRQEEIEELENLLKQSACPIPLKREFGSETREGKVAILLQAYISRAMIKLSDVSYVVQSATRLLRALFEISLRSGTPAFSLACLELARASELRIWPHQHPLWQFTYLSRRERSLSIAPETIAAIEASHNDSNLETLRTLGREELSTLIRAPRIVESVERVLKSIPILEILSAKAALLSRTVLSVQVCLFPNFQWHDSLHGKVESWWIWIEDKEEDRIYHSQKILLTKKQVKNLAVSVQNGNESQKFETIDYNFTMAVFDPPSSQYWVRIESDRWHSGGVSTAMLSVASLQLPREERFKSSLSSVNPAAVRAVLPRLEAEWFGKRFSHFNPAQMAALQVTMHSDDNVMISAPQGSGKYTMAEFAILRALNKRRKASILLMSPDEGTLIIREQKWNSLTSLGIKRILNLTKTNVDNLTAQSILPSTLILVTAATWNKFVQKVDEKEILRQISLVILNNLHRLSEARSIGMELFVIRFRQYCSETKSEKKNTAFELPRLLGLSDVLPNAAQIGEWIGVSRNSGLLCLDQGGKQVHSKLHMLSVAGDRYSSRMQSMNRPLYSTIQRRFQRASVLIFVGSRRQSLLTARDLLRLASLDGSGIIKLQEETSRDRTFKRHFSILNDVGLREVVSNGIGLVHEYLSDVEVAAVTMLFRLGYLEILIATYGMVSWLNVRAQSVIVKGTDVFNREKQRFEDLRTADLIEMTGLAGRMGSDAECTTTIFVHEPKLALIKMLMHDPLPVESGLLEHNFNELLLDEIVNRRVADIQSAIEWLSNSFFFQRLQTNPGLYGLKKKGREDGQSRSFIKNMEAQRRNTFCRSLLENAFERLILLDCVVSRTNNIHGVDNAYRVSASAIGQICNEYGLKSESAHLMKINIGKCTSMEDILDMLCRCSEVEESFHEFDEEITWSLLSDRVVGHFVEYGLFQNTNAARKALGINGWADVMQKRVKLLVYSLMVDHGGNLSEIHGNRGRFLAAVCRVSVASIEIAGVCDCISEAKWATRLLQCLKNRCVFTKDFWHLTGSIVGDSISSVKRMQDLGWRTIEDVLKGETEFLIAAARMFSNNTREAITRWLQAYPRISIKRIEKRANLKEHGESNDAKSILFVTLKVVRSRSRTEAGGENLRFVIIAYQKGTNNLIGMKRVVMLEANSSSLEETIVQMEVEKVLQGEVEVWVGAEDYINCELETSLGNQV